MYVQKNIVDRFPGEPDKVGLQGGDNSDIETNGQEKEQSTDQLRRSEQRALPPDQWKAGATVNQILTIPNPHVSPQQPDWEVMASKHVLPHMLRDGYELNVDIKGKSGATDKSVHHGFPIVGGKYVQIGECVPMSILYAAFNLDARKIYHDCWHSDLDSTNGLFPNQSYKNDPPSIVRLALLLLKRYNGLVDSIEATELHTMTTKIRGSGANSKIEGDTPRDAVQQEERGGSAGKVADNQRLTPLNLALQNLNCREAVVPLFFPRSVIDMAESHSKEFLGQQESPGETPPDAQGKLTLWGRLLQEKVNDLPHNPLMVFMGMYSAVAFRHDKIDRDTLHSETMKYLPDSERERNMQCFKSQNHMCLTLALEKLSPPGPSQNLQDVHISNRDTKLFMISTKSGVRNALSLSHPDSVTKEDITSSFVTQQRWRDINNEENDTSLESGTTVDVGSFVERLCGVSVAACFRFKRNNIIKEECFYLDDNKYEALGAVSRMKPMPMPSRANDAGPLFFQWSFGFDRLNKDMEWCKTNLDQFSEAIFQAVFHTLTGRVVYLEQLSNHLRQHMEQQNLALPTDPDQPIYPTTTTFTEAIYFINSTLKGNRTRMSTWITDQFSKSIPSGFKIMSRFELMLKLLAQQVNSIATNILNEDDSEPNENKRETAFVAIYSVLEQFAEESEKKGLRFVTSQILNNLEEVLLYPFGTKEEYADFDYMIKSVYPGYGGCRGADAFRTTNVSWNTEPNNEKRMRAKLKIIWQETREYMFKLSTEQQWIIDSMLLQRKEDTLCWTINNREISLVDCEHWLCKSYIGLASVRPSRCITNPRPSNNYTHPTRLVVDYPRHCHNCVEVAIAAFEETALTLRKWPPLDKEYEYNE